MHFKTIVKTYGNGPPADPPNIWKIPYVSLFFFESFPYHNSCQFNSLFILSTPNWAHIICTHFCTYFVHPIGCINCIPNYVTISTIPLSKASALQSPIWNWDCVPNWVHYVLHPIGYIFLRPVRILWPGNCPTSVYCS